MSILLSDVINWTASTSGTLVDGADRVSFSATSVSGVSSAGHYNDFYARAGDKVTLSFMARIITEPVGGLERPGGGLEFPSSATINKVEVIGKEWRRYVVSGIVPINLNSEVTPIRVAIGSFTSSDGGADFRDIIVDVKDSTIATSRVVAYAGVSFDQSTDTATIRTSIVNRGVSSVIWDPTYLNLEFQCEIMKITDRPFAIAMVSGSGGDTSIVGQDQNLTAYAGNYNTTTGKVMVYFKNTSVGGGKIDIATLPGNVVVDFKLEI